MNRRSASSARGVCEAWNSPRTADDAERVPCPHCGVPVDSRLEPGRRRARRETRVPTSPTDSDDRRWTARRSTGSTTWTRGSLGSLGRFQLRERLGDGGFGQVFLAYDPRLDRDVAIKVLKQPEPERAGDGAVLPRGPGGRPARPPQHRGRPRRRLRRRPMLGRLSARRRPTAVVVSRPPSDGRRRRRRGSSATWPMRSTTPIAWGSSIATSSRPTSHRRPGAAAPDRLRPGPPVRLRVGPDPRRRDRGDAGLHEPRAGPRPEPAGRRAERRLQPGRDLLRAALPADAREEPDGVGRRRIKHRTNRDPAKLPSARSINPAVPAVLDAICTKAMSRDPSDRYPTARALADDARPRGCEQTETVRRRSRLRPGARLPALCAGVSSAFCSAS